MIELAEGERALTETHQDLLEYASSDMTLEATIKAEIKAGPDMRATGKRPFRRDRRKRAQGVTEGSRGAPEGVGDEWARASEGWSERVR